MTNEQLLWGGLAILLVFVLNQVFGRMLAQYMGKGARDCDRYVPKDVHTMCTTNTTRQIEALSSRFEGWEQRNRQDHETLFGKLDELKDILISKNGHRP
jgi:hypothetical protein